MFGCIRRSAVLLRQPRLTNWTDFSPPLCRTALTSALHYTMSDSYSLQASALSEADVEFASDGDCSAPPSPAPPLLRFELLSLQAEADRLCASSVERMHQTVAGLTSSSPCQLPSALPARRGRAGKSGACRQSSLPAIQPIARRVASASRTGVKRQPRVQRVASRGRGKQQHVRSDSPPSSVCSSASSDCSVSQSSTLTADSHSDCSPPPLLSCQPSPAKERRSKLPLRAVYALRSFFTANVAHPYPTEQQKAELARHCGLTARQVTNWSEANTQPTRAAAIPQPASSPSIHPPTLCTPVPCVLVCCVLRFTNTRRRFLVPFLHKLAQAGPAAANSLTTSACELRADSPSSFESSGGSSGSSSSGESSQWRQQRVDMRSSHTAEAALGELAVTESDSAATRSEAAACGEEAGGGGVFDCRWSEDASLASGLYAESRRPHGGIRFGGAQR